MQFTKGPWTCTQNSLGWMSEIFEMKGTDHRVLFQNADGNINMGLFFNDRTIENFYIYWINCIAMDMSRSLENNEGLIVVDEWSKTTSCYVELHRIGTIKVFNKNYRFSYQGNAPEKVIQLELMAKTTSPPLHH